MVSIGAVRSGVVRQEWRRSRIRPARMCSPPRYTRRHWRGSRRRDRPRQPSHRRVALPRDSQRSALPRPRAGGTPSARRSRTATTRACRPRGRAAAPARATAVLRAVSADTSRSPARHRRQAALVAVPRRRRDGSRPWVPKRSSNAGQRSGVSGFTVQAWLSSRSTAMTSAYTSNPTGGRGSSLDATSGKSFPFRHRLKNDCHVASKAAASTASCSARAIVTGESVQKP